MTYIIGIDPGMSGAVGVIDHHGAFVAVRDLPTVDIPGGGTVKRRLHGANLIRLFREVLPAGETAACWVEDVQAWGPGGASSTSAMMGTKMVILAMLDCFAASIDVRMVPPAVWKRHLGLRKPVIEGASPSKISTAYKAMSRARAVALYPTAEIREARHDGRAEALLIAHYGRMVWQTEATVFDPPAKAPIRKLTAKQIRDQAIDARIPLT